MSVDSVVEAAVLHSDADGIRRITLNRPETANALRPADRDRVIELLAEADESHAIRVVVLAANGRHFCSGADVGGIARSKTAGDKHVTDSMRKIMNGAAAPTSAISLTTRLLNASPDTDRASSFLAEAMAQEIQSAAEDSREGVRSFTERRPPEFRGF
jgi:enoyl-CoA hydratase/carnithine racemase